jgi:hypothetical protein
MTPRRFPPPWSIEEGDTYLERRAGWQIKYNRLQ